MSDRPLRASGSTYVARLRARPYVEALPALDLHGYAPGDVAFAARAWTMRAEQERRSAGVFAALVSALIDCGEPLDLAGAFTKVVADEVAHAELCAGLAGLLETERPVATPIERPTLGDPSTRRLALLRTLLVEGAIGETVSSAFFALGRSLAREPCTRAALTRILRDEVTHARLSWRALHVLRESLTEQELEAMQLEMTRAFGFLEESMVPAMLRLERGEPFRPAWGELGVLPPERRLDAFYRTIEGRVTRELAALGLDPARGWKERYRRHQR